MKKITEKLSLQDWLAILSLIYGITAVSMNIFCMKALSFGTPFILCDGGLLISWGVFLVSNIIVEVWDERTSRTVIGATAITTFFIMLLGRLIVEIPTLSEYSDQADAFSRVFSNGPRTIIASVTAFWVGNLINVHIISIFRKKIEEKKKDNSFYFFFRASFSTLIGQFTDNALFMIMAFAPIGLSVYEMAWTDIISSVLLGTVIELAVESLFVPLITIPATRRLQTKKAKEAS